MHKHPKGSAGFTLFELIVSITILALLFVGGYTGYSEFARRQLLTNTYNEIKTNVNLAKQLSLAGKKPNNCTGTFLGYTVSFSQISYTIAPKCAISSGSEAKTVTVPQGLTLTLTTPPSGEILFKALGQGTDLAQDATLQLNHTVTGNTRSLTITKRGVVQ